VLKLIAPDKGGKGAGPLGSDQSEIEVTATGAAYAVETARPSGWFETGQEADLMLSGLGFNQSGGPLLFNHPGAAASDGQRLVLPDRNNNRVLVWNSLPDGNVPPDLVLGQADFSANNPGDGLDEMNWPVSASLAGGKLVVADTYNDRILIWNTFPTRSGQPADLALRGQPRPGAPREQRLIWPWGVWTDGERLVVSSTLGGQVMIWNTFPTRGDQPPDICLDGDGLMGTPRTITSDGRRLIVGDHNYSGPGTFRGQAAFVWSTWPAADDQPHDFVLVEQTDPGFAWLQGDITADGGLVLVGRDLNIWDTFPTGADDPPTLVVGGGGKSAGFTFSGGDGSGVAVAGGRTYVTLANGNRVVVYEGLPETPGQMPDFAIGSDDIEVNTLETSFIISNPVPQTDGRSLFVSSDFDRRLYVWASVPGEDGAHPDFVYDLPFAPWASTLHDGRLVLAGQQTVLIWENPPRAGEPPDRELSGSIGGADLGELVGVALDQRHFYLADATAGAVYVWEGLPGSNDPPAFALPVERPGRLSSDGQNLVVTRGSDQEVLVYSVPDLSAASQPAIIRGSGPQGWSLNLPGAALAAGGHLFIADTCNSRVLVWESLGDAVAGVEPDLVLGQDDLIGTSPAIGRDRLFWPDGLAFDGSYLWVGEFKFSERLVRFSLQPEG